MQELTQHVATCQPCKDKALQNEKAFILFGKLTRAGLASVLSSHCAGCLQEFKFSTSSKVQGMTGGKYWEANLAAVWGQMCTGGGHKSFVAMAVLGVQTMSKQSFISTERKIGEWWRDLFEESITFLCIFADNYCTTREEYKLHLHQTGVTFGFYCSLMASLLTTRMFSWIPCPMSIDKTATGSKTNSLELKSGEQFESNNQPSNDRSSHETSSFKPENQVPRTPAVGTSSQTSKDLKADLELNLENSIDKTATGSKTNSLEFESGEQFESNNPLDHRSSHETSSSKAENQVPRTSAVGSWSRISKDLEEDSELNNFENTEHSDEESGSSQTEYHF